MSKLDEIEARAMKATPGPWHVMQEGFSSKRPSPAIYATGEDLHFVAKCADFDFVERARNKENAVFIAHAREDIPYLLARLKKAEALLKARRYTVGLAPQGGGGLFNAPTNLTIESKEDSEIAAYFANEVERG